MKGLRFWLFGFLILAGCGQQTENISTPGWLQLQSMPTARSEMPAVALNGLIYVPGGFGDEHALEVFDPVADSWQSLARLPEPRHHLMVAAYGAAAYDGQIYIFGGAPSVTVWTPQNTVWSYDPAAGTWVARAPMPEARIAGAAVTVDGYIYIVGGAGGTNALLRYDPSEDRWVALASLTHAREHTAAVALNGKIYALGGRWRGLGELSSVEIYDPAPNTWREGVPMQIPRAGFAAAILDGKIVVAGGEVLSGRKETLASIEVFDPMTGIWDVWPDLPFPLHGVPAVGLDGALYVIGGSGKAGAIENEGRTLKYTP